MEDITQVYLLSDTVNIPLLKMVLMTIEEFNKGICANLLRGDDVSRIDSNGVVNYTDEPLKDAFLDKYFLSEESLKEYNGNKTFGSPMLDKDVENFAKIIWSTLESFKKYKKVAVKLLSHPSNTYSQSLLEKLTYMASDSNGKYIFENLNTVI